MMQIYVAREKRELRMKKNHLPVTALSVERAAFTILCCALLMLLTSPAWAQVPADPCNSPSWPAGATPAGSVGLDTTGSCGLVITITGTSGNLTATLTGGGTANNNPYDGSDDVIVGIQNNSSVNVGAIRLYGPSDGPLPAGGDYPFSFDGDGPCFYVNYSWCPAGYYQGPQTNDSPLGYSGPDNIQVGSVGVSADYTTGTILFDTPIPPNQSTWFAVDLVFYSVVSIGESQTLATQQTNVFPFGPFTCPSGTCTLGSGVWTETATSDDFKFTPVSALTGSDTWTFLPIPVCAGPVGDNPTFGPFENFGFVTGNFGKETPSECANYGPEGYGPPSFVTNFGGAYPNPNSLACTPYSDYSSANNPTCVELQRTCIGPDCATVQWTAQVDYDIDANSIYGPIGGPAILWAQGVPGPTSPNSPLPYAPAATDFNVNALTSYTGANVGGDPPPGHASGSGGGSVFVSAFSPTLSVTNPIPVGVTVGFPGYEFPTANSSTNTGNNPAPSCSPEVAQYLFPGGTTENIKAPVNCLVRLFGIPIPWLLAWDYTNTNTNAPITNLELCPTMNANGTCATKGVSAPWVHLSLVPVTGCGSFTGQSSLPGLFANIGKLFPKVGLDQGQYTFLWEPVNNPTGCQVSVLMQFDTGRIVSPAVFLYSF
jgi:hypothetical protein